ncbi:MAG: radical SAM protein [Candidatus Aminicenantes bacterium]|nr:radical SAM protein [Candidatus Aminicenantes bacterium]
MLDLKFKIRPGHTSERAWMEPSPLKALFWNVTYACNFACPVCFTDAGRRVEDELSPAEALAIADAIGEAGVRDVLISGGEPFLRPGLLDLLARMSGQGISLRIATNGTLLNDDTLKRLKGETLTRSFQVSLETTDPLLYARVHRTSPAMYKTVREALSKIQAAGFHTTIAARLTPATLPGIPALFDLAFAEGWPTVTVHLPVLLRRADETFAQDDDLLGRLDPVFERFAAYPGHWLVESYIPWAEYHPTVRAWESKIRFVHRGCRAGRDRMTIEPDGGLSPCVCMDVPEARLGNLRTDDLRAVFRDAPLLRLFRDPGGLGICVDCANLRQCGGGCRAAALSLTGRIDGMDLSCPVRKSLAGAVPWPPTGS